MSTQLFILRTGRCFIRQFLTWILARLRGAASEATGVSEPLRSHRVVIAAEADQRRAAEAEVKARQEAAHAAVIEQTTSRMTRLNSTLRTISPHASNEERLKILEQARQS